MRYVAGTVLGAGGTRGEEKDIGSRGERDVNQLITEMSIPLPAEVRAEGGAQGAGGGLVSEEDDGQGRLVQYSSVATNWLRLSSGSSFRRGGSICHNPYPSHFSHVLADMDLLW